MSKQLTTAVFYMGKGYGASVYEHDLEDNTSIGKDLETAQLLTEYAKLAVDFVEMGFTIAMEYPEGLEHNVYADFGNWFGQCMAQNTRNAYPTLADVQDQLADFVMNAYEDLLSEAQQERLAEQIKALF